MPCVTPLCQWKEIAAGWGPTVAIAAVVLAVALIAIKQFKLCPSNRILVVRNRLRGNRSFTCLHGGARLVVPLLETCDWLHLEPLRIEIPLEELLPDDAHRYLPGVFHVAIGTTPDLMQRAAAELRRQPRGDIQRRAERIIRSRLEQTVKTTGGETLRRDSQAAVARLRKSLENELNRIGLVLIYLRPPELETTTA